MRKISKRSVGKNQSWRSERSERRSHIDSCLSSAYGVSHPRSKIRYDKKVTTKATLILASLPDMAKPFAFKNTSQQNRNDIIWCMHQLFEKANALTGDVIAAAVEVQNHFGIGLLENIYKNCLAQELRVRGHNVQTEVTIPITYKGFTFDEKLRIDCLVDHALIVECKSLDEDKVNMTRHRAQLLSYMKLMDIPLGLVINFGDYRLGKRGVSRVILAGADSSDEPAPF